MQLDASDLHVILYTYIGLHGVAKVMQSPGRTPEFIDRVKNSIYRLFVHLFDNTHSVTYI